MTELTSITLGARVWGASALRVEDYDHTGVTMNPIARNNTGQRWYIEQDQATAADDSSEDILDLVGQTGSGPAVRYQVILAARAPDGDTISVQWYRDGSASGSVITTFSDTEWRLFDLGVKTFSMQDWWNGVPITLRLYGGLVHASFIHLIPRAIPYIAEDNPGADATTASVSYAFNGEAVYRAAPWGSSEQMFWGPVTPSSLAPTGESDFVQVVALWKGDSAYPDGGGGLNANWVGYIATFPAFYVYVDGVLESLLEGGGASGVFMEQFIPYAMIDPMAYAKFIDGTGIQVFDRGFVMNEGSELDFRWEPSPLTEGDDSDAYLDQVYLARPATPPSISGDCDSIPVGTASIFISWSHTNPERLVRYGVQVFHQNPTWGSAIFTQFPATSPYELDTSAWVEGETYRVAVVAEYIDSSFTYDWCDILVGAPVYMAASLAKAGISLS